MCVCVYICICVYRYTTTIVFASKGDGWEGEGRRAPEAGKGGGGGLGIQPAIQPSIVVELLLDSRSSVAEVKEKLSAKLAADTGRGIPAAQLRLFLPGGGGAPSERGAGGGGAEIKDVAQKFSALGVCCSETVFFALGEPLKVNEYELRVDELGMKDVTLLTSKRPAVTVRACLRQSVALLYASCAAAKGVSASSFRLRRVLGGGGGVGAVLRSRDTLADCLPGVCDGLTLAFQPLPLNAEGHLGLCGGDLPPHLFSIFVRWLAVEGAGDAGGELGGGGGGGVCRLQDAVELIVGAGMTEEELEGRVSSLLHPPAGSVLRCTAPSAAVAISGDASLAATGLFVPLPLSLFVPLSLSLFVPLSLSLFVPLPLPLFVPLPLSLFVPLPLSLFVPLSLSLFVPLSLSLFVPLSLSLFVPLSLSPACSQPPNLQTHNQS